MIKKLRFAAAMIGSSLDGVDFAVYDWSIYYKRRKPKSIEAQQLFCTTIQLMEGHVAQIEEIRAAKTPLSTNYERQFTIDFVRSLRNALDEYWIRGTDGLVFHGPTLRHEPKRSISLQLGDGQLLSNLLGTRVMNELRQADLDAGGQGAPLMPILDAWCFNDYDGTLNLGGIANVSLTKNGEMPRGWDICGCNQLLNFGAGLLGAPFDKDGAWAGMGIAVDEVLVQLEQFEYLQKQPPKSLSNKQVEQYAIGLFKGTDIDPINLLASYVRHIVKQISAVLNEYALKNVLITGGGAKNKFLIDSLRKDCPQVQIDVPEDSLINYKECQLLSLMGLLNVLGAPNALASVTGATHNTIGGKWYKPVVNES
ncbi:MAG TPA: anhydro-N-acetylmuramic acid kinase [Saprospiraceae bacterium]|nr:anhydro-N-acetylmuramic acid kinase [Saprospiraceae bacterium]